MTRAPLNQTTRTLRAKAGRWPPQQRHPAPQPSPPAPDGQVPVGDLTRALQILADAPGKVLGSGLYQLGADGTTGDQYRLPYRSLAVTSRSASPLIISAAPKGPAAPGPGPGAAIVPPYGHKVANIAGYAWTIYGGNNGDLVSVEAWSRPQPPVATYGTPPALAPIVVTPANPAAGAGFTYTFTSNGLLLAVTGTLVTSAAVANRMVRIQLKDAAGDLLGVAEGSGTVAASSTANFSVLSGYGPQTASTSGQSFTSLPYLPMLAGWTATVFVSGMDVADQLSALVLTVLPFPAGQAGPWGSVV